MAALYLRCWHWIKAMFYTQEHLKFIKRHVKGTPYVELLKKFNAQFGVQLSLKALQRACNRYNMCNGLDGRFPKGQVPHNKGKKGLCYPGSVATQFKKGHTPSNHRPVGSERISVDGYIEIKVAEPHKWQQKHSVIYEQMHGAVPKGCAVIFADGDKSNITTENLVLVTRAELLYLNRNNMIYKDAMLTKSAVAVAKLATGIYRRKK